MRRLVPATGCQFGRTFSVDREIDEIVVSLAVLVLETSFERLCLFDLLDERFQCDEELVLVGVDGVTARLEDRAGDDLSEIVAFPDRPYVGGAERHVLAVTAPGKCALS